MNGAGKVGGSSSIFAMDLHTINEKKKKKNANRTARRARLRGPPELGDLAEFIVADSFRYGVNTSLNTTSMTPFPKQRSLYLSSCI